MVGWWTTVAILSFRVLCLDNSDVRTDLLAHSFTVIIRPSHRPFAQEDGQRKVQGGLHLSLKSNQTPKVTVRNGVRSD